MGLHWVNSLGARTDVVKKTMVFKKKIQFYQPLLNVMKMTDVKCKVKQASLCHWLAKGLP